MDSIYLDCPLWHFVNWMSIPLELRGKRHFGKYGIFFAESCKRKQCDPTLVSYTVSWLAYLSIKIGSLAIMSYLFCSFFLLLAKSELMVFPNCKSISSMPSKVLAPVILRFVVIVLPCLCDNFKPPRLAHLSSLTCIHLEYCVPNPCQICLVVMLTRVCWGLSF